jgi:hypothetical protein
MAGVFDYRSIMDCPVENSAISSAVTSALCQLTGHMTQRGSVVRASLTWQFAFLDACGTTGLPLQAACDAVRQTTGHEAAEIRADLLLWLPAALDAGMVTMTG